MPTTHPIDPPKANPIGAARRGKRKFAITLATCAALGAAAVITALKSGSHGYEVRYPTRGPITEAIYGLGTVRAARVYSVKPGVATRIRDVEVEEGQAVRKGQLILRTDEFAALAPWNGVVTSLAAHSGENVMPGTPVVTLTDPNRNYLLVSLEQQDALRVRPGQTARISFENLRDQSINSRVKDVYSKDEQQFNIKIELDALPPGILPGMTADVSIEIGRRENAILVPVAAIHEGRIALKKGRRFQRVPCRIGVTDGSFAEIIVPPLTTDDEIQVPRQQQKSD